MNERVVASGAKRYLPVAQLRDMPHPHFAERNSRTTIGGFCDPCRESGPTGDLLVRHRSQSLVACRASTKFDQKPVNPTQVAQRSLLIVHVEPSLRRH